MATLILIAALLAGALCTAFIVSILAYMNTNTLEEANRQLRKEIDSVQQRLQALERSPATTVEAPAVVLAKAAPAAAPIPPAAVVKAETVKAVPAPPASEPAPTLPDTPAWIERTDGLFTKAKTWLLTGNLVAKLGLLILFLGVSFLLKYVSAQVTLPIELRLAGIALLDIALLAWAWRIRLSRPGISLPLQGTALAILMLVTFGAFRLYGLMPAGLAFALLFVLTALTCLLAVLQNAVWLAV
ncbi:MAG: hypothetical protein RLZZ237_3134, partial [Pseudomonadota bacterium]